MLRPEMPATSMALVLLLTLVTLLVMEPDFGQTMLILTVWGALFFLFPTDAERFICCFLSRVTISSRNWSSRARSPRTK